MTIVIEKCLDTLTEICAHFKLLNFDFLETLQSRYLHLKSNYQGSFQIS